MLSDHYDDMTSILPRRLIYNRTLLPRREFLPQNITNSSSKIPVPKSTLLSAMKIEQFWMLLTFLVGLICGHRFSLGREKRKEFNELSREPYRNLISNINQRRVDKVYVDVTILSHYFTWKRRQFVRAAKKYEAANIRSTYDPSTGINTTSEKDIEHLMQCARELSKLLTPR